MASSKIDDEAGSDSSWTFNDTDVLGTGRIGSVFAGHDDDGNPVAVKRIVDGSLYADLGREGEISKVLRSATTDVEHIVVPKGWATTDGDLYIVMPRADQTLDKLLDTGPLDQTTALDILDQVAAGLAQLHNLGIIYRDLKPSNTLLIDGRWCLADFSISRNLDNPTATSTVGMNGTYPYMSPEVWRYEPTTVRSDLYSLGVLAHELLTGHRPFPGPDSAYKDQHLTGTPPELPATVLAPVRRIVTRLLRKASAERPQDAVTVREAIARGQRQVDTDALTALRAAAADDAERSAAAEARTAQEAAAIDRRDQLREQALTELRDTFEDAHSILVETMGFDDADFSGDGMQHHLSLGGGRVTATFSAPLDLDNAAADTDEIVAVGGVYANAIADLDIPGSVGTIRPSPTANIVYLIPAGGGRAIWELWYFNIQGVGHRTGVFPHDFVNKHREMTRPGIRMMPFTVERERFTPDALIALLTGALNAAAAAAKRDRR